MNFLTSFFSSLIFLTAFLSTAAGFSTFTSFLVGSSGFEIEGGSTYSIFQYLLRCFLVSATFSFAQSAARELLISFTDEKPASRSAYGSLP